MPDIYSTLTCLLLGAYIMLMAYSGYLFQKSSQNYRKYLAYIMYFWVFELILSVLTWLVPGFSTVDNRNVLYITAMMLFPTSTFIIHVLMGKDNLPLRIVVKHEALYVIFLILYLLWHRVIFVDLAVAWSFIYTILVIWHYRKRIKRYQLYLYDNFSNTQNLDFEWLNSSMLLLLVFALLWSLLMKFSSLPYATTCFLFLSVLIWFYLLHHINAHLSLDNEVDFKSDVDTTTGITEEVVGLLREKLDVLCQQERVFQDPNLRIQDLALKMHTNRGTVTAYIRNVEKTNFYMFINQLRIRYAEKLLAETTEEINSIAQQAGYTSIYAFKKAFELFHQVDPQEYRDAKKRAKNEIKMMNR